MPGIFIKKGMTVGSPPGGFTFRIDEKGELVSNFVLHVHYEMGPKWFQISMKHLIKSREDQKRKLEIWKGNNDEAKSDALEDELESSMQAMMASGIALDAIYASILERTQIPDALRALWRKKRTARPYQITEVLRRAFRLSNEKTQVLRTALKQIFNFRDLAVHPHGKLDEAAHLPEIDVGVEKRFAMFRYQNAILLCQESLNIAWELANADKFQSERIEGYCKSLKDLLHPVVIKWTEYFGILNEKSKHKIDLPNNQH